MANIAGASDGSLVLMRRWGVSRVKRGGSAVGAESVGADMMVVERKEVGKQPNLSGLKREK